MPNVKHLFLLILRPNRNCLADVIEGGIMVDAMDVGE